MIWTVRCGWNDLKRTYFGDANLDGEFNSGDFVEVFVGGDPRTTCPPTPVGYGRLGWRRRIHNGRFRGRLRAGGDTSPGPREATRSVPEPTSLLLTTIGFLLLGLRRGW